MGKIIKAFSTGISSRRRKELKAFTLMVAGELFNACFEFENFVMCGRNWSTDLTNVLHKLGRIVSQMMEMINFTKTRAEKKYVYNRLQKYVKPVIDIIVYDIERIHSINDFSDDNRGINNNDDLVLTNIDTFHKNTLKKLFIF